MTTASQNAQARSKISLYEVLFSLTVGFAVAGVVLAHDLILWPFVPIYRALSPKLLAYPGGLNLASDIAFVATALMYWAFAWLLLRSVAGSPLTRRFLSFWSGAVLFIAPWLCWVLMAAAARYSLVGDILLAIEAAICTFSVFYLPRRARGLGWHVWFIVALNWCVWVWVFWRGIPSHAATLIPAVAALSSVTWLCGFAAKYGSESGADSVANA
jgi:hypothetical protein